ncbi:hypothetical protein SAMN05216338_107917 [Bradyrhizobium sp. Rc2d]|uniref:hypothetical protein n=1 Tax=Bradyrhizobium sp. Rc2d TaxID=1855321 RepID=UPI000887A233|nr:hypothetical protein [Bradyrhizobium sp. Rc2d]SDK00318.1 hypothetical protein SAMN05216338_107917 [Bradyrhizobium sp. Rc2d]
MAPVAAKPISLTVRPLQVANLCFEVGGILGESFVELGSQVSAFNFDRFYMTLRGVYPPTTGGPAVHPATTDDPSRLKYDSDGIDAVTKHAPKSTPAPNTSFDEPIPIGSTGGMLDLWDFGGKALAAMRAETAKSALNKAVNARANAFITKYGGAAAIADVMRKVMPQRGDYLNRLSELSIGLKDLLEAAYLQDFGVNTVIRKTSTVTSATSGPNKGSSMTKGPDEKVLTTATNDFIGTENQKSETTGFEYRSPNHENQARDARTQIGLGEEIISFVKETHFLDRLEEVYRNELESIDADVNQLQVAYLNTILMSPIDGIVTGVYKNPGDPIAAGEPVYRVENNAVVLIVARVVCREPIAIGSILQVKTTLFDAAGSPAVVIEAPIVSVRGQGQAGQWEVVAKQSNRDAAGKQIFPIGYNFDYDNTEVNIVGVGHS